MSKVFLSCLSTSLPMHTLPINICMADCKLSMSPLHTCSSMCLKSITKAYQDWAWGCSQLGPLKKVIEQACSIVWLRLLSVAMETDKADRQWGAWTESLKIFLSSAKSAIRSDTASHTFMAYVIFMVILKLWVLSHQSPVRFQVNLEQ